MWIIRDYEILDSIQARLANLFQLHDLTKKLKYIILQLLFKFSFCHKQRKYHMKNTDV